MSRVRQQNVQDFTVSISKDKEGKSIVGTGFIVSPDGLIVTCAHVVRNVGVDPRVIDGESIFVSSPFLQHGYTATVKQCIPEPYEDDVVLLKIAMDGESFKLDSNHVAILGRVGSSAGHTFKCYGYRRLGEYQGLDADGTIGEIVQNTRKKFCHQPIRLDSKGIQEGMSGSAILDVSRNLVIGVGFRRWESVGEEVSTFADRDTAFAVAADVLALPPFNLPIRDDPLRVRPDEEMQRLQSLCTGADRQQVMRDRLRRYVGREQELEEIHQRIDEMRPRGGYVLITGPAGQGKSSIIAKLVEKAEEQSQDGEPVIYHVVPYTPGADHHIIIIQNLLARLICRYDHIGLPGWYATDTSSPSSNFQSVLKELSEKGEHVVIFIDGLDQIDFRGQRDLTFLPSHLPQGIVFVLSTRPDDTMKFLERYIPENNRIAYPLGHFSSEDFQRLLQSYAVSLEETVCRYLYTALESHVLYLDLVAQELQQRVSLAVDDILQRIDKNPNKIYDITIERLQQSDTWAKVIYPVFGVLLVAREPLSSDALRHIVGTGTTKKDMDDGLLSMGGVLSQVVAMIGEQEKTCYTLYHLKFGAYLNDYLFASDETEDYHRKIADWCDRHDSTTNPSEIWHDATHDPMEHERRIYARHHYVFHLYQAKKWERLFTVLDKGMYGKHKIRWDMSTHSYATDLDLGRQASMREGWTSKDSLAHLPHLWRYSLLRCSLASWADHYPDELFEAMAWVDREQEALAAVELLTEAHKKSTVLCDIAHVVGKRQGNMQQRLSLLRRAWDLAQTIDNDVDHKKISLLLRIAGELTGLLDSDYAQDRAQILLTISKELDDLGHTYASSATWVRTQALVAMVLAGQEDDALSMVSDIDTTADQVWARLCIAHAVAQLDHSQCIPLLVHVLDEIGTLQSSVDVSVQIYQKIVTILTHIGMIEQACTIALKIETSFERNQSLHELALALIQTGAFDTAHDMVRHMDSSAKQVQTLREIATRLLQDGNDRTIALLDEALTIAGTIDQADERARALSEIAPVVIQTRDSGIFSTLSDALDTATNEMLRYVQTHNDADDRVDILCSIAKTLVHVQRERACAILEDALKTAKTIQATNQRAWALQQVARIFAFIGHSDTALEVTCHIEQTDEQAQVLGSVATIVAQTNKDQAQTILNKAVHIMQGMNVTEDRALVFERIVSALIQSEQLDDAIEIAHAIDKIRPRSRALVHVVEALVNTGQIDAAWNRAKTIESSIEHVQALGHIATKMADTHDDRMFHVLDEMYDRAHTHTSTDKHEHILKVIVEILVRIGRFDDADNLARSIVSVYDRTSALCTIAASLVPTDMNHASALLADMLDMQRMIVHSWYRAEVLSDIARVLIQLNDGRALAVCTDVINLYKYHENVNVGMNDIIPKIVDAWLDAGQVETCVTVVRSIENVPHLYVRMLMNIAGVLAQASDPRVTDVLDEIVQRVWSHNITDVSVLGEIVAQLTHMNDTRATTVQAYAETIINACDEALMKAWYVYYMAVALKLVNEANSVNLLDESCTIAREIKNTQDRDRILSRIARAYAVIGHYDKAHNVIRMIDNPRNQAHALIGFATLLAQTGDHERLLRETQDAWKRATTRDELITLLDMAIHLIPSYPPLGRALADGFTWVDNFLKGQPTVPIPIEINDPIAQGNV